MTVLDRAVKFLLPREEKFFDLMEQGAACVKDAGVIMEELCSSRSERFESLLKKLRDVEHNADGVIHATYDALNRTFVTPLDRSDIYALSNNLEEIVDLAHATAMQLLVHSMDEVPEGSAALGALLRTATDQIQRSVSLLRNLKSLDKITEAAQELSRLEHEADEIFRTRVGALFREEKNAVRLIQHKEFLEGLERTLDACDHLGVALRTIVIKNA